MWSCTPQSSKVIARSVDSLSVQNPVIPQRRRQPSPHKKVLVVAVAAILLLCSNLEYILFRFSSSSSVSFPSSLAMMTNGFYKNNWRSLPESEHGVHEQRLSNSLTKHDQKVVKTDHKKDGAECFFFFFLILSAFIIPWWDFVALSWLCPSRQVMQKFLPCLCLATEPMLKSWSAQALQSLVVFENDISRTIQHQTTLSAEPDWVWEWYH